MGGIGESQISDSDSSKYSDSEDGSDFDGDQLQEIINNGHQNSLDKKLSCWMLHEMESFTKLSGFYFGCQ